MFHSIKDDIPRHIKSAIKKKEIIYKEIIPNCMDNMNTPIHSITWKEANVCCATLSNLIASPNETILLPTEAQWEYACKAGLSSNECNSKEYIFDTAWTLENSTHQIHQVGKKRANPWGLYDMQGNIYEWCNDWYGDYKYCDNINPAGINDGNTKTIRGGSWKYLWHEARSTSRGHFLPSYCHMDTGFRPVIICPEKENE